MIGYFHVFGCISKEFMVTAFENCGFVVDIVTGSVFWWKTPTAVWATVVGFQTTLLWNLEFGRAVRFPF